MGRAKKDRLGGECLHVLEPRLRRGNLFGAVHLHREDLTVDDLVACLDAAQRHHAAALSLKLDHGQVGVDLGEELILHNSEIGKGNNKKENGQREANTTEKEKKERERKG
jgi:hypothetical protein